MPCIEGGESELEDRLSCTVLHNAQGCGTWHTPQHKMLALPIQFLKTRACATCLRREEDG